MTVLLPLPDSPIRIVKGTILSNSISTIGPKFCILKYSFMFCFCFQFVILLPFSYPSVGAQTATGDEWNTKVEKIRDLTLYNHRFYYKLLNFSCRYTQHFHNLVFFRLNNEHAKHDFCDMWLSHGCVLYINPKRKTSTSPAY